MKNDHPHHFVSKEYWANDSQKLVKLLHKLKIQQDPFPL